MKNQILQETSDSVIESIASYFPKIMSNVRIYLQIQAKNTQLLIERILEFRQKSSTVITNFLKCCKIRKQLRDEALINSIIIQRKNCAQKIQNNYRRRTNYRNYHNLYEKVKDCYSIYPSIVNEDHPIVMRVFLDKKCQLIKVQYCSLRKAFVVDIPKSSVKKIRKLSFNYLVNNMVIIDPKLVTKLEKDQYVNVVDFDLIEAKEKEKQQNIFECILAISKRRWSINESCTTNADELHFEDCEYKNEFLKKNSLDDTMEEAKIRNPNGTKTVKFSTSYSQISFEKKIVRPQRKHMTVKTDISIVKSILKPSMSTSSSGRCLNNKKVCFGKVQFSF